MGTRAWFAGSVAAVLLMCVEASAAGGAVTFSKDVLPILQKNCQACHRPGNIAPMSFLSYETARPWAKAMKAAVVTGKMPPWFADPQYGHFSNDRSLKQEEIDTIVRWVDGGAQQGDPNDAPPPIQWAAPSPPPAQARSPRPRRACADPASVRASAATAPRKRKRETRRPRR